jgi:hypothetical protein
MRCCRFAFILAALICAFSTERAWSFVGRILHPFGAPDATSAELCQSLAKAQREHVHVLLVNGLDPGNVCNFRGIEGYVRDLGFDNVRYYQMWQVAEVKDRIRSLRANDRQSRIMLVGYSAGTQLVCNIAHALHREGLAIDVLVYLGGDTMWNAAVFQPPNCHKIVNIRALGLIFMGGVVNGQEMDGARNHHLGLVRHAGIPNNQQTLRVLADELYHLGRSVPVERSRFRSVSRVREDSRTEQQVP